MNKGSGDYNAELLNKIDKLMIKNETLEKELGQLRYEGAIKLR